MKNRWTARAVRVQVPPPAPSFCPRIGSRLVAGHHDPASAGGMEPFREGQTPRNLPSTHREKSGTPCTDATLASCSPPRRPRTEPSSFVCLAHPADAGPGSRLRPEPLIGSRPVRVTIPCAEENRFSALPCKSGASVVFIAFQVRSMNDERREHLIRFYSLIDRLEKNIAGARTLAGCSGRMDWPGRGV